MLVGELTENIAKRQESRFITTMGQIAVATDCSTMTVVPEDNVPQRYLMDEQATSVLSKYLKIPYSYVKECPPDERARTLSFWMNRKPDVQVMFESVSGGIVAAFQPGLNLIPVKDVGAMVERLFKPEDQINQYLRSEDTFHLDISSDRYAVDIPNPNRVFGRPEVGDITRAGIRFQMVPNKVKAPSVGRYFHRLWCTNGCCTPINQGKVSITGLTVPEIIASMEEAAERLLSSMDDALDTYAKTAEMEVPGHPVSFAEQVGHDANLPRGVMHRVLEHVRQLPANASVYDVNQAFTAVGNETSYATRNRLQTLGGSLALNAPRMIERCTQCERLLVDG